MCNCYHQKPQLVAPMQCCQCCQHQQQKKPKIKGKFGVAYVIETGDKKTKPCGWEVEFNDTPSQIEQSCKKMMKWISCPPLGECDPVDNSLQCCRCQKEPLCACQRPSRHPNCCCNQSDASKGQKMYFSSKKQCCHYQSDSSMEAQRCQCECNCGKCKCMRKSMKKLKKEEHKASKNWQGPESTSKKDRELRSIYTVTREEPRKGPDKVAEEREIRSIDYEADFHKKQESNEDQSLTIPEVDSPPLKKKIKGNQLLKLIKNEHRKEMEAIHPLKA